jgi:hypothetical protein
MKKSKSTKIEFKILDFDDYHSIHSEHYKTIELGCFPPKNGGYFRYYGVFYKGRKPSIEKVMKVLDRKLKYGSFIHDRSNEEIGVTREDVLSEVKINLKNI